VFHLVFHFDKELKGIELPFIAMCLWETRAGLIYEEPPGTSWVISTRVTCTSESWLL
jgi:hypothetical protein